jgi:hypothetical protein
LKLALVRHAAGGAGGAAGAAFQAEDEKVRSFCTAASRKR